MFLTIANGEIYRHALDRLEPSCGARVGSFLWLTADGNEYVKALKLGDQPAIDCGLGPRRRP
jgi:hypothetical protein